VKALLTAVAEIDDLDPLRIAALKAMKRVPPPPINLSYVLEEGALSMYVRNTVRKRKVQKPALCTQLPAPAWLFQPSDAFPGESNVRG
jgi:hypothetical protein